jgi:hypothetical protein
MDAVFGNKQRSQFMVPSSVFLATTPTIGEMRQQLLKWQQKETPIQGEDFEAYTFRMSKYLKHQLLCACAF